MPRYELIEGGEHGSRKFWEIALAGSSIERRWGRIGTKGQTKTNSYSDPREAQRAFEELIAEKTGKGYQLVEGTGIARAPAPKPAKSASNPDLERAIEENPGDEEAWLVYGDWLQSEGDPRGELIALQAAMRREKNPAKFLPFKKQESELLYDHKAHFQGGLEGITIDWRYGFVFKAAPTKPAEIRTLVDHPSGRFFQEIEARGAEAVEVVAELARLGRPRTLRRLSIDTYGELEFASLAAIAKAFPRLERLTVRGNVSLDEVPSFPALKTLTVHGGFDAALLQARWPALESLILWPAAGGARILDPLLDERDSFPKLVSLELGNVADADGFVARLAKAPLLAHLKKLEVRSNSLTDLGARAILNAKDRFAHLEKLGLFLEVPREVYEPLKKVCKSVEVSLRIELGGEPKTGKRGEEIRRYEPIRE